MIRILLGFTMMALLPLLTCKRIVGPLEGAWAIKTVNEAAWTKSEHQVLYSLLEDGAREAGVFYFTENQIEYPLGFLRQSSRHYRDNFLPYQRVGQTIKLNLKGEELTLVMELDEAEGFWLRHQEDRIVQLVPKPLTPGAKQLRHLGLKLKDEFTDCYLTVDQEGRAEVRWASPKEQVLKKQWDAAEFAYLQTLLQRLAPLELEEVYNPLASDVIDYDLKVELVDGESWQLRARGLLQRPQIPFELKALLVFLDKKCHQDKW